MTDQEVREKAELKGAELARGTTFSYRHAWGTKFKGRVVLTLDPFQGIRPDTRVWVSSAEAVVLGDPVAGCKMGSAPFAVLNVVPLSNKLAVRLHIDWPDPLAIITNYIIEVQ
jgi:hypothetical protein